MNVTSVALQLWRSRSQYDLLGLSSGRDAEKAPGNRCVFALGARMK